MSAFPVRCFSCGKVLGELKYLEKLKENGGDKNKTLNDLNYTRWCCRRMFLGHNFEVFDKILQYSKESYHVECKLEHD